MFDEFSGIGVGIAMLGGILAYVFVSLMIRDRITVPLPAFIILFLAIVVLFVIGQTFVSTGGVAPFFFAIFGGVSSASGMHTGQRYRGSILLNSFIALFAGLALEYAALILWR